MSVELSRQTEPKARREYSCDCYEQIIQEWVSNGCWLDKGRKVSFGDLRKLIIAKREGFKILKGTTYINQRNLYDGQFYTWRSRKDLFEIACKYNLDFEIL